MVHKEVRTGNRLIVQYEEHPKFLATSLCSLMEHQSMVDMAIRCGDQTLHAHKVILAANSPYFREQLESNPDAEQIILNGMDFMTLRSIIEFIYCGETSVLEENLKFVVAAAKLFQIRGLQALGSKAPGGDEIIYYPPPIFINQKPKYSNPYVPPYSQMDGIGKVKMHMEGNPNYNMHNSQDYLSDMGGPLPSGNYPNLNAPMMPQNNRNMSNMNYYDVPNQLNMNKNVTFMYKTAEGEYVDLNCNENSPEYQMMVQCMTRTLPNRDVSNMPGNGMQQMSRGDVTQSYQHEDSFANHGQGNFDDGRQCNANIQEGREDREDGRMQVDGFNGQFYSESNYNGVQEVNSNTQDNMQFMLQYESGDGHISDMGDTPVQNDSDRNSDIDRDCEQDNEAILLEKDDAFTESDDEDFDPDTKENSAVLLDSNSPMTFYNELGEIIYDENEMKISDEYSDSTQNFNDSIEMPSEFEDNIDTCAIDAESLDTYNKATDDDDITDEESVIDFMLKVDPPPVTHKR